MLSIKGPLDRLLRAPGIHLIKLNKCDISCHFRTIPPARAMV
ncbi:hypothetical protein ASAP_3125 [Asaia bogorensis]|uniref:Uncharacterized protein n=1 Tax=Asaia bogorensis TaxID=91915 RepID=A0A060QJR0_9PROT|nr:hypothetical protein ASAP_3125 [Asaia bogorensis]